MTILGLENEMVYVIYNPIRIVVEAGNSNSQYLEVTISHGSIVYKNRFYPVKNMYSIELQKWLQLFFENFECDFDYNVGRFKIKTVPNKNLKEINIRINIFYLDPTLNENQTISRQFLNGYNNNGKQPNTITNFEKLKRVHWRGYPFSKITDSKYNEILLSDGSYNFGKTGEIEMKTATCKNGIYVRWLSYDSDYNYWLFEGITEKETTKEIGSMDRWFLNEQKQTSNEDTLGLTSVKEFTLTSKVSKEYWSLINTIFRSPEIYILNRYPDNNYTFVLSDWRKVRIKGQSYSNKSYEEAKTYSIDFIDGQQYSQTLI